MSRSKYTVEAGRQIYKDGVPYVSLNREGAMSPTEADDVVHGLCALLNEHSKNVAKASVHISTRVYERNHGAKPRGRGYWLFVFGKEEYVNASEAVGKTPSRDGAGTQLPTFAEAKVWAREEAVRRGVTLVGVCP